MGSVSFGAEDFAMSPSINVGVHDILYFFFFLGQTRVINLSVFFMIYLSYIIFALDAIHYENTPIQIYLKFYHHKNENFQTKFLIFFLFLLKT